MNLCQLSGHHNWSFAKYIGGFGAMSALNSMWRLEESERVLDVLASCTSHLILSFDRAGANPKIVNGISGKPEAIGGRQRGAGAGDRIDADAPVDGMPGPAPAPGRRRPAFPRRSRGRSICPASRRAMQLRQPRAGVVLVKAERRRGESRNARAASPFAACPRRRSGPPSRSTRSARSVMSSRLPMGVATTNNVPDIGKDSRLLYHCGMCAHRVEQQSASYERACTHRSRFPISSTTTSPTCTRCCPPRRASTESTCTTTCSRT